MMRSLDIEQRYFSGHVISTDSARVRLPLHLPSAKRVHPMKLPPRINAAKVAMTAKPTIELIYRDPGGDVQRKIGPWQRPATGEALTEYVENYFELLADGYRPNLPFTPIPHCARLHYLGKVIAEWRQSASPTFPPESPVTGGKRAGSGGIPTVTPSAPCSERLAVPTLPGPCGTHSDSASSDRDPSNVVRLGQATLTTG